RATARAARRRARDDRAGGRHAWRRARSDPVALEEVARDHETLDLVRTLADDHERGIAIVPLDAELLHVPVASEHPHGLERDFLADAGGEVLGQPGLEIAAAPCVLHRRRLLDEEPRGFDLRGHVGELQLDGLVLADGLAPRGALLAVADGILEGRARDPHRT